MVGNEAEIPPAQSYACRPSPTTWGAPSSLRTPPWLWVTCWGTASLCKRKAAYP